MAKYTEWLTEEGLIRIKGWAMDGLVDRELAAAMGISRTTLNKWRKKFPEFEEALKTSKEVADRKVEHALFDRCVGQFVSIKKPVKLKRINYDPVTGRKINEEEVIEYADEQTYIPSDVKAQEFWLINRKPDYWKQRPEAGEGYEEDEVGIIEITEVQDDKEKP